MKASGPDCNPCYITAAEVKALLRQGGEMALIDVREEGVFSRGHQLLANNVPLSQLEVRIADLVPRKEVLIVLVDGGAAEDASLAVEAAARMRFLGYTNVHVMEGGVKAWAQAGFIVFAGVHVPSKAFGEFVEHAMDTPRLEPEKVKALRDSGAAMVILDSRPNHEYTRMNIPGGINVPGGELVYHIGDLAPNPDTLVVINCAGRTRSIIGAQSLLNAGIPNKVVALKGGTMGWELAGLQLERGTLDRYSVAPPSPGAVAAARERAGKVAAKYGVSFIDMKTLSAWRAESASKTLYVFDVRQPAEFVAGHMPGARNIQGVTLVQSTDLAVAVRNGRIVLVDDTEVRAVMTASWLIQMGYPSVHVLQGGITGPLEQGPVPPAVAGGLSGKGIAPPALLDALQSVAPPLVVDIGSSREYRLGHISGAYWCIRSMLDRARAVAPEASSVVLTSGDGFLANVATADAATLWPHAHIAFLHGGTEAWIAAGFPVETSLTQALCPAIDVYNRAYDGERSKDEERQAMIDYLAWEEGLVDDVVKDGDLRFQIV